MHVHSTRYNRNKLARVLSVKYSAQEENPFELCQIMLEMDVSNLRYQLELHRNAVHQQRVNFDKKWGEFLHVFMLFLQANALLCNIINVRLLFRWKIHPKVACLLALWSITDSGALLLDCLNIQLKFTPLLTDLASMVAALSRSYGALLFIAWFHAKFHHQKRPSANSQTIILSYFPLLLPSIVFAIILVCYHYVDPFIVEVYPSGSDILNIAIVSGVFLLYGCYKATGDDGHSANICAYLLLIAASIFLLNLPKVLLIIWQTFVLDYSWTDVFHVYCLDFLVLICQYSAPTVVCALMWSSWEHFCYRFIHNNCYRRSADVVEKDNRSDADEDTDVDDKTNFNWQKPKNPPATIFHTIHNYHHIIDSNGVKVANSF